MRALQSWTSADVGVLLEEPPPAQVLGAKPAALRPAPSCIGAVICADVAEGPPSAAKDWMNPPVSGALNGQKRVLPRPDGQRAHHEVEVAARVAEIAGRLHQSVTKSDLDDLTSTNSTTAESYVKFFTSALLS